MQLSSRLRSFVPDRRNLWVFWVIIGLAAFLRFYALHELPPGIHPDEAANGLDIIRMADEGDFRVLYNTNGPREALFFYLQAPFVLLLGASSLALRIAPALIGVATVAAIFLLVRLIWGSRAGLVTAFMTAILPWHLHLSRDGFRAIMVPLITTLVIYFYLRGVRDQRRRDIIFGGFLLGLGFYTYLSYQLFPLVIAGMLTAIYLQWPAVRSMTRPILASLGVAVLTAVPLLVHGILRPGELIARTGGVSVLSAESPVSAILENVWKTALSFNVVGDENFRHNLGGAPLLDPVTGIFFLVGLVYFVSRLGKPTYQLVLLWLTVMLLPGILSNEGIPHGLRTIGAIVPAVIIAGVAATWTWSRLAALFPRKVGAQRMILAVIFLFAGLSALYSYGRYFVVWAGSPETYAAYSYDATSMGRYLAALPDDTRAYYVIDGYSAKTVEYLTWRKQEAERIEPSRVEAVELPAGKSVITFGLKQREELDRFSVRYPGGEISEYRDTYNKEPAFLIYEVAQ